MDRLRATIACAVGMSILLGAGGAGAAMAPQFERWSELQAVIGQRAVVANLYPHGPIDRIEVTQQGVYRIWAGGCHVDATVTIQHTPVAGRGDLRVTVSAAQCN